MLDECRTLDAVILAPIVTEKATFRCRENQQVVFRVVLTLPAGNQGAAVEPLFKVQVESVQVLNRKRQSQALWPLQLAVARNERKAYVAPRTGLARKSTLRR